MPAQRRQQRTRVEVVDSELMISRGVCEACGWTGPERDTYRDRGRVFLNLDRDDHERTCREFLEDVCPDCDGVRRSRKGGRRMNGRPLCRHERHCSHAHAELVAQYQAARHAWELEAEAVTCGYAAELEEYREANPPPTFREWLEQSAGARDRAEVAA